MNFFMLTKRTKEPRAQRKSCFWPGQLRCTSSYANTRMHGRKCLRLRQRRVLSDLDPALLNRGLPAVKGMAGGAFLEFAVRAVV